MYSDLKKSTGMLLNEIGVKDSLEFTVVVGGHELPVVTGRVARSIDTCADGCSATVILNDKTREYIHPFGFEEAQVFLGGELVLTGYVYGIEPRLTRDKAELTLNIDSSASSIVDSVKYPPYEFSFVTLGDLVEDVIGELGLNSAFESYDVESEFFERVAIDPEQKIFDFLMELCKQRGVIISSNEKGEVLFRRAKTTGKAVETLTEVTDIGAQFDGRDLFGIYRVYMTAPVCQKKTKKLKRKSSRTRYVTVQTPKYAEAYDSLVPASRQTTTRVDNVAVESLPKAAEWERSRRWAKACTISLTRPGWRPKGSSDLYRENTLISLKAPSLWLAKGFDFLIKSVEYTLDSNGASTVLTLIPPQAYTGEPVPDIFGGGAALSVQLKSLGLPGL